MASTKIQIDRLWETMRDALDKAYSVANAGRDEQGTALRDYARDIHWHDATKALLREETANERQHRRNRPSVSGFSVESAAKLILMEQAGTGAAASEMPRATAFLVFRQSAVEAQVIGFLAKKHLPAEWRAAIAKLDYAKLMQPKQKSVTV